MKNRVIFKYPLVSGIQLILMSEKVSCLKGLHYRHQSTVYEIFFCIFCLHLSKTLFVIELKFDRTLVLIFYEGKFLLGVNNFLQQENKEKKICWLPYEENRRNCWHFVCHVCCSNNVRQKNSKLADSYFHILISWFNIYH